VRNTAENSADSERLRILSLSAERANHKLDCKGLVISPQLMPTEDSKSIMKNKAENSKTKHV
jgi:hypothetical protein